MAVSIDTVYQRVLSIANKEQRGYITPLDFNLLANQAQLEMFEQYFHDINQFGRLPGNSYAYSDMVEYLDEKLSVFQLYDKTVNVLYSSSAVAYSSVNPTSRAPIARSWGDILVEEQRPDIYRVGTVRVSYGGKRMAIAEKISVDEINTFSAAPLARYTENRPVYIEYPNLGKIRIKIYPYPSSPVASGGPSSLANGVEVDVDRVSLGYIRKP